MSGNAARPNARPAPLPVEVWGATDPGRVREGNEDTIYPDSAPDAFPFRPSPEHLARKGQLLVVADGVGGATAGAEASRWVVRVVVERYYDAPGPDLGADLRAAVEAANASLHQYLQTVGARGSGSTMAAAVIHGDTLYVANVGDSRVYLLRDGRLFQQTRDHTLTRQKLDLQLIRPEQAASDPDRNVLTRSLGPAATVQVDLFPPLRLRRGDGVLVCSDGLADMLDDETIARLAGDPSPKRAAQRLVAAANRRGGRDNISAVLARVGGPPVAAAGRLAGWQRAVLLIGAVVIPLVLCLLAVLGWQMWTRSRGGASPTATPPAGLPILSPGATPTSPADKPDEATSTPMPTFTPTPTARPPIPTPTGTPTPTPTATPGPPPAEPPPPGPTATGTPAPSATPTVEPTLTPPPEPTQTPTPSDTCFAHGLSLPLSIGHCSLTIAPLP